MKKLVILAVLIVTSVTVGFSQDNVDFGLWNDIQLTTPLSKNTDLALGVRFDTKGDTSRFSEQRIYGGFNFKNKTGKFTVQPWVIFLKNFARTPYTEVRPQVTVGYKFTTENKVNITPRVRLEYHAKHNLPDDGRVVPILAFDKKVSKNWGVFNTNEFWIPINNSRDATKYRKRMFLGATRKVNSNLSVDMFYLYQRDERVAPRNTHKLGLTWKIRLQ